MKIRIHKRTQNTWLTLYVLIVPILFAPLMAWLNIPSFLKYTVDAVNVLLLVSLFLNRALKQTRSVRRMLVWVLVFFMYTIIRYLFGYQSLLYYLWGARNNFRFYIFFFACIYFLDDRDLQSCFRFLDIVFHVNVLLVLIQFFAFDIRMDNLGGIFGTGAGCNGWLNIFQVIIVSMELLRYLNRTTSLVRCAVKCFLCLVVAAMAELKFFFVEFAIIICLGILITDFTWKKLWIILGTIVAIPVCIDIMLILFPSWAEAMSLQGLLKIAISDRGYTSSGDVNRMNVISYCNQYLMDGRMQHIFGYGLGNCDYADGIEMFTSPFFEKYELTHYTWLSTAFMYLENGYIGLVFYFGFFALIYAHACKYSKMAESDTFLCQLAQIAAIMSVIIGIYNSSLRVESAYMLYFVLAVPFINVHNNKKVDTKI